jgi:SAM-dependent methyltransferase
VESETFRQWAQRIREPHQVDRKLWEFCFIAQALSERGMLQPGRRGLGFAVGREPLPALFASYGCEVVATDLDQSRATEWIKTGQHAAGADVLNDKGICDPEAFRKLASFRVVDMNAIPNDLRGFDFCWSSCAFEHLGSISRGKRFLENMTPCLKPGGIAVHTTEFNTSSNVETLDNMGTVLFRRQDIEAIVRQLTVGGHRIEVDFHQGHGEADRYVDEMPYRTREPVRHLKLRFASYVTTSIGLIIEVGRRPLVRRFLRFLGWWAGAWPGGQGRHAQQV